MKLDPTFFGDGAVMRLSASILLVLCAASAHGLQLRHRASRGLPCLNDCSSALGERGVCVHGVCVCNAGFRGPDCSISTLPDRPIFEPTPGFLNASDDEAMAPGQTCKASTCNDICTYGGMCLDAATCICSLDRDDAALEKKAVDFARQAKEELDAAMAKPVRPLSAPEFLALSEVVGALGAVMAPGDPCVNWKQWLGITCSVDGAVHAPQSEGARASARLTAFPSGTPSGRPRRLHRPGPHATTRNVRSGAACAHRHPWAAGMPLTYFAAARAGSLPPSRACPTCGTWR